jgi:16S rRNA (guanine527-N7)-methyltransferase
VATLDRPQLERTLDLLGLGARPDLPALLWRLALELEEWASKLGLSNITDFDEILLRHVLDSLLLSKVIEQPEMLVDVGTGPGMPAAPLALLWPETRVVAIDSRRKSGWFVERLAQQLPARNLSHVCARAESGEALRALGGQADVVCSRGLAKPRRAVELCAGFAKEAGLVVVLTGPEADELVLSAEETVVVEEVPGTEWRRRILLSPRRCSERDGRGGDA